MDPQILHEFLTRSWEDLSQLGPQIVALQKKPGDDRSLANIARVIHTVNESCLTLPLPRLGAVAQAAEKTLSQMRAGNLDVTPNSISLLIEAVARMKEQLDGLEATGSELESDDSEVVNRLRVAAALPDTAPELDTPLEEDADESHEPSESDQDVEAASDEIVTDADASPQVVDDEVVPAGVVQDEGVLTEDSSVNDEQEETSQADAAGDVNDADVRLLSKSDAHTSDRIESVESEAVANKAVASETTEDELAEIALADSEALERETEVVETTEAVAPAAVNVADDSDADTAEQDPQTDFARPISTGESIPTPLPSSPQATQPVVWQEVIAVDDQVPESGPAADFLLRLTAEDANHLMNLVGEHMLTSNQLLQLFRGADDATYADSINQLKLVTAELWDSLVRTWMKSRSDDANAQLTTIRDNSTASDTKAAVVDMMIVESEESDARFVESSQHVAVDEPVIEETIIVDRSSDEDSKPSAGDLAPSGDESITAFEQDSHQIENVGDESDELSEQCELIDLLLFTAVDGTAMAVDASLVQEVASIPHNQILQIGERHFVIYHGCPLPLVDVVWSDAANEDDRSDTTTQDDQIVIVLEDNEQTIGLMVKRVQENLLQQSIGALGPQREGVQGIASIDEKEIEVVDVSHLVAMADPEWFRSRAQNFSRRVLIVDNSLFFRQLASAALESEGYQVVAVESAVAAVELIEEGERFDAIVSDLDFPEVSGFELAEWIRTDDAAKDTPLIALTSAARESHEPRATQAGFNRFLTKLHAQQLLSTVDELCRNGPYATAIGA